MPLIRVGVHAAEDIAAWSRLEHGDAALAATGRLNRIVGPAMSVIREFGPDTCSVSWGKDSVVCAHLCWSLVQEGEMDEPALVWVRVRNRENPYCHLVRDAFLKRWPMRRYHEIECDAGDHAAGELMCGPGFAEAVERFGPRRITGLRADESGGRKARMSRGLTQGSSCAPIGRWTAADVFAYLYANDLPVHPVYAMSFGGSLERDRIRTAQVGGQRGRGHGRAEWEARYLA